MHRRYDFTIAEATKEHPRHSEGSLARLRDGRLLVAWSAFAGGGRDDSTAHIAARLSEDMGLTWGAPWVLRERPDGINVMSVSFRRLRSGALLMAWLHKRSLAECMLYVSRAIEEPDQWAEPVRVTQEPGYYVMNNDRLVELSSGRLVAPVSWTQAPVWSAGEHFTCHCWLSDDGGRTWFRSRGEIDLPKRGAMEPGAIERADGTLLMIIRSQLGHIFKSMSADGGMTWSEPTPLGVAAPEAPATIGRLPDGRLALVYNPYYDPVKGHGGPRTPLRIALSEDEGDTWRPHRDVETDPAHTYAYASWYVADGYVFLTYYMREEATGLISLKMVRLETEWFA